MLATLGGPMVRNKAWFFTSFEGVHENASIAYSPASMEQFDALSQLASQGLIPGAPSIATPNTVPIPFRDYLGSVRFDWAQSPKSHWFLRTSEDSYTHPQRTGGAGNAAFYRTADPQQLLERGAQQLLHLQPQLGRQPCAGGQPAAPYADAQLESRLRACFPLQLNGAHHLRVRNVWR